MAQVNPSVDPLQFIKHARELMGTSERHGPMVQQFFSATEVSIQNSINDKYPNFWQVGCVFDTILDYFLALKEAEQFNNDDRVLMDQLMVPIFRGYQYGIVGLIAGWYDDWSWWGIATSKAFDPDYEEIFGKYIHHFQHITLYLWGLVDAGEFAAVADDIPDEVWLESAYQDATTKYTKAILSARSNIHKGTRKAWALIELGKDGKGTEPQNANYEAFAVEGPGWAAPRFPHGCWQYDMSSRPFPPRDGYDWCRPNPHEINLGPFQLTLMSGLYLSFCCSLMAAATRKAAEGKKGGAWDLLQPVEAYRQKADEVVGFLAAWIDAGPDSLASVRSKGVLLQERITTYAALSDGTYPPLDPHYYKDSFWGGDQGLVMGALAQYRALVGAVPSGGESNPPILATFPSALMTGVFHNMPADGDVAMVGPSLSTDPYSPIHTDTNDYGSGSGIFWRYVMRCCRLDSDFKSRAMADPEIVRIATNSGLNWNGWGNDTFRPFNTLAAAIGAWYLLK